MRRLVLLDILFLLAAQLLPAISENASHEPSAEDSNKIHAVRGRYGLTAWPGGNVVRLGGAFWQHMPHSVNSVLIYRQTKACRRRAGR